MNAILEFAREPDSPERLRLLALLLYYGARPPTPVAPLKRQRLFGES